MIGAVVFDLDGVLLDSEHLWDEARRQVVEEHGGRWRPEATGAMQGMSSPQWAHYLRQTLGVSLDEERIVRLTVERLTAHYEDGLPFLPGAQEAVRRLAAHWPLALASSSNREVIDLVLAASGLAPLFPVTVSSEEVPRGKPDPDVYLEAGRRLAQPPSRCVAVEDSANGVRSAAAAGMAVVALPNHRFPPPGEVLAKAALVIDNLAELTVERLEALDESRRAEALVDEEEIESFPASDPHSDWAGPAT